MILSYYDNTGNVVSHMHGSCICIGMYMCMYTYVGIYTWTYVYKHAYMEYMYACMHIYMYI